MKRLAWALLVVGLLASLAPRPATAWCCGPYQVCPNMMWPCYGCCGPAKHRGYPPGYCGHGSWGYWPTYQNGAQVPVCRRNGFANFAYRGVTPWSCGYGYGFGSTPPGAGLLELYW